MRRLDPAQHPIVAYLATLLAIVVMTALAVTVCVTIDPDTHLPQILAALGFISSAVTGLIGVIGAFRPKAVAPTDAVKPLGEDAPQGDTE